MFPIVDAANTNEYSNVNLCQIFVEKDNPYE
jgi:hypothetical protein